MGCCSGKSAQKQMEQQTVQTRGPLIILYGTTYGMSSKFAFSMASEARHKGFIPKVNNVGDFPFDDLPNLQFPVMFLLSTYGTGGPTQDASIFYDNLMKSTIQLNNLKYGIFGLGNSTFEKFCGMAVSCDEKLQQLQAQRIFELSKGDAEKDTTEKNFNEWKSNIWQQLEKMCPLYIASKEEIMKQGQTFIFKQLLPDAHDILSLLEPNSDNSSYETQIKSYLDCQELEIEEIYGLKNTKADEQTYHVILKDQNNKQISYQTAGNVMVYPENDIESVNEVAKILNYNLNDKFDIEMKSKQAKKIFPTPTSVNTFLSKYCDLHGPVSKSLLYSFSLCMQDQKQAAHFQSLTSFENDEQFQKEIFKQKHSLLSLLRLYKVNLPFTELINISQRMPPRQYTISCSNKVKPNKIELTITILKEGDKLGLFTGYLLSLAKNYKGKTLRLKPVDSPFKYPTDPNLPIVCVSTGAGIGPFIAFCQEKQATKAQNNIQFYFGCRNKKDDYIYQEILEDFKQKGIINDLHVAFSREQSEKIYVQNLIEQNKASISKIMFEQKGKLYICGSQRMSDDVQKSLAKVMTETQGIASYLTMSKISRLKQEGYILTEIQK